MNNAERMANQLMLAAGGLILCIYGFIGFGGTWIELARTLAIVFAVLLIPVVGVLVLAAMITDDEPRDPTEGLGE
jgi:hypothetical protein